MDIDGLGEHLVAQLVDRGLVHTPVDIYKLDAGTIAAVDRMGEKSANNLLRAIEQSKRTTLERFIHALGIRNVGESTATDLARHFGTLDLLMSADLEQLQAVPDVGPIVAESICRFFAEPHNVSIIRQLRDLGVNWPEQVRAPLLDGVALSGKTFVITGTLPTYSRDDARKIIKIGRAHV